jgi:hypothetical protein
MAVTLKCPDCGHTAQSEDESPRTCPQCEGTMKKPAYKAKDAPTSSDKAKPKAKADEQNAKHRSAAKPAKEENPFAFDEDAEDEPKPKKKPSRSADEDEDEPRPKKTATKPAKKEEPLSLDDDDEKGGGGNARDDAAAKSLDIDSGFTNKKLMRQVEEELSRGEVLHWAGRMCPEIAEKNAGKLRLLGIIFAAVGGLFSAVFFAVAPWYVGLIPLIFVAIGVAIAVLVPKIILKQAALGWYAVTNRRAIVYAPSAFGSGGEATSYEPSELRRMRVKKSNVVDGAGDLVFKTRITERRTDYVDRRTGQTTRSETSTSETLYGFLGIENVREVETLVHNVLLEDAEDE